MKVLIIASSPESDINYIKKIYDENDDLYVICADGGIEKADKLGISVDLHIGDFDSASSAVNCDVIRHPCEKDWTDTEACIYKAIETGADEIYLTGILGGRADHMMSNLLGLLNPDWVSAKIFAFDRCNIITKLESGAYTMPDGFKYMSVVPVDEKLEGVTLEGVKYPLQNAEMYRYKSLGISNEITEKIAHVTIGKGRGLLIFSKDAR